MDCFLTIHFYNFKSIFRPVRFKQFSRQSASASKSKHLKSAVLLSNRYCFVCKLFELLLSIKGNHILGLAAHLNM